MLPICPLGLLGLRLGLIDVKNLANFLYFHVNRKNDNFEVQNLNP